MPGGLGENLEVFKRHKNYENKKPRGCLEINRVLPRVFRPKHRQKTVDWGALN